MGVQIITTGPNLYKGSITRSALLPPVLTSNSAPTWQTTDLDNYKGEVITTTNRDAESKHSMVWIPLDASPAFSAATADWCSGLTMRPPGTGSCYDNQIVTMISLSDADEVAYAKIVVGIEFVALPGSANLFNSRAVLGGPASIAESWYALKSQAYSTGIAPPPLSWSEVWKGFKHNLGKAAQTAIIGITSSALAASLGDPKFKRYEKHLISVAFEKFHLSPFVLHYKGKKAIVDDAKNDDSVLDAVDAMSVLEYAEFLVKDSFTQTPNTLSVTLRKR